MLKIIVFFLLTSILNLSAQFQTGQSIDKIEAIVGKQIIMKSDIDGRLVMMYQQNPNIDLNDESLRKEILNSLIDEKLILTKALEDSIEVNNDEVESRWQVFLESEIQRYGSEQRIEKVYGKSIPRIKSELIDEIKNQLISYKLTQEKFGYLQVNKREVEEFYENFKDSLQKTPASYEIYHIVKKVSKESDQKKAAFDLALSIRDSIVNLGVDFADLAKRNSDDTYTAKEGGNLGWFDKTKLFEEFVKAATSLSKDQISQPIETPLGYHIIQLIDKDDTRINTRHILIKLGQSDEDIERIKNELIKMKDAIAKGDKFEDIAKLYSDETETKGFGGYLGKIPVNQLPPDLVQVLEQIPEGGVSDPLLYQNDPISPSYRIIYKKSFIPEHTPTLEQDYEQMEQRAIMYKRVNKIQEWVQTLREELYWEIK